MKEQHSLDLFLLLMNLSQVSNSTDIKRLFSQALSSYFENMDFCITDSPDTENGENLVIKKGDKIYGYLLITGEWETVDRETQSLIRNAVAMLAVFLENRFFAETLKIRNKELQDSLDEKQTFVSHLVHTAPILIYVYELSTGMNIFANKSIMEQLGYSAEDLKNMKDRVIERLVHPNDLPKVLNHHAVLTKAPMNTILEITYRMKSKEGEWFWLFSRDTPYRKDENGVTTQIIGSAIDITEQKNIELELTESKIELEHNLHEKEVLLREIHHRVKNNMQVIISLLNLQETRLAGGEAQTSLRDATRRVFSMALVHEMLYTADNYTSINLKQYVIKLIANLKDLTPDTIKFVIAVDDMNITINSAVPVGIIINELVTNAIKYAFPGMEEGIITISFHMEGDKHHLCVSDNGIGLPESLDIDKSGTLGLTVVLTLIKQIEAQYKVEREKGTRFCIIIPRKSTGRTI